MAAAAAVRAEMGTEAVEEVEVVDAELEVAKARARAEVVEVVEAAGTEKAVALQLVTILRSAMRLQEQAAWWPACSVA